MISIIFCSILLLNKKYTCGDMAILGKPLNKNRGFPLAVCEIIAIFVASFRRIDELINCINSQTYKYRRYEEGYFNIDLCWCSA